MIDTKYSHSISKLMVIAAAVLSIMAFALYYFSNQIAWFSILWVLSLCLFSAYFYAYRERVNVSNEFAFDKIDFYIISGLYVIFIPIYLWLIDIIPYQVGADELHVMNAIAGHVEEGWSSDPFGLSNYFGFSKFIFLLFGSIAKYLFGEINHLNLRMVHAIFGLLIIFPAYIFFRLFWSRVYAFGATALLMSHHALVDISRIVSRNNVPVLNEVAAFLFLLVGLKRKCPFMTFIGGMVAGFSFYHYCAGRTLFFVWLFYIFLTFLFFRHKISFPILRKLTLISILGFSLVIMPIMMNSFFKSSERAFQYGRNQLLIFSQGREHQRNWTGAASEFEGVKHNVINGLTLFNNKVPDQASQYSNIGHGFVDPLTGVLVWVGLFSLIFRPKKTQEDLFVLGGFLFFWLIFMFVSNLTPNYTRLLIFLPIIICLVVEGLRWIIQIVSRGFQPYFHESSVREIKRVLFILGVVMIFYWNGMMWGDFIRSGFSKGDSVGSTLRYLQKRKFETEHNFYTIFNKNQAYFIRGFKRRFGQIVGWDRVHVIQPEVFYDQNLQRPFTIFIYKKDWRRFRRDLLQVFPDLTEHSLVPSAGYMAIEVK